jgi:hypothetical protein
MNEQDEPVEIECAGDVARLAGGLLSAGLSSEADQDAASRADHGAPRRQVIDVADAMHMRPETEDQQQRHADVDEDQHGEEAVVDRVRRMKLRADGSLKIGSQSSSSVVAVADNCASWSQTIQ